MKNISAVLFDLDGTLFNHELSEERAIQALHRESDLEHISPDDFFSQWRRNSTKFYKKYTERKISFQEQRTLRVQGVWESFGKSLAEPEANEIFESYLKHYEAQWCAFDDAIVCLTTLKTRFRLGMITNGNPVQQRAKLRRCELDGFFEDVVISEEVGVSKPSSEIFHLACERMGVEPANCYFVGDHFEQDVQGSLKAGLRPVWISRHGAACPREYAGIAVKGLEEFLEILA